MDSLTSGRSGATGVSAAGLLALALAVPPARAQAPGLPLYGGGFTSGVEIGVAFGFPGRDARTGAGWLGGVTGTYGFWQAAVTVTAARFDPDSTGSARWSYGVMAGVMVLGDPLSPFALYAQAGAGHLEPDQQVYPLGTAMTLTIPTPLLSIRPWIAPRVDVTHSSSQGASSDDLLFAYSARIDLSLLNGLSFRAMYDKVEHWDGVAGLGVAFHF